MKTIILLHLVLWGKMTEVGGIYPLMDGRSFDVGQTINPSATGLNLASNRGYFLLVRFGPRCDLFYQAFVVVRHTRIIP